MDMEPDAAQSTSAEQSAKRRCEAEESGPRRTARTAVTVQPFLHSTNGAWSGDARIGSCHDRVREEGKSYKELEAEVARSRDLRGRLDSFSQQLSELGEAGSFQSGSPSVVDSKEAHAKFVAAQVMLGIPTGYLGRDGLAQW